jgi:hypothetical protein
MTTNNIDKASSRSNTSDSVKVIEKETGDMEANIAKMAALLSNKSEDNVEVSELLARLENADGMAQGVEDKLDGLLGKLDDLLTSLETQNEVENTASEFFS